LAHQVVLRLMATFLHHVFAIKIASKFGSKAYH
jgi:hypothetical protein